MVIRMDLLN